jgi:hypothetical protein
MIAAPSRPKPRTCSRSNRHRRPDPTAQHDRRLKLNGLAGCFRPSQRPANTNGELSAIRLSSELPTEHFLSLVKSVEGSSSGNEHVKHRIDNLPPWVYGTDTGGPVW